MRGSGDETASTEAGAPSTESVTTDAADTTTEPPEPASSAGPADTEPTETTVPTTEPVAPTAANTTSSPERCSVTPGLTESTLVVGSSVYDMRIYLPTAAQEMDLIPTVLVFHGGGDNGTRLASSNGFEELAESEGFAVVHPNADPAWPLWEIEDSDHPERDDLAFASELIGMMINDWCADPSRIYSVGSSIGGTFSARLGCEIPDQIAGFGVVAQIGVAPQVCDPPQPTPAIQFNGTADPVIPFTGNGESVAEGPESWRWMIETVVPEAFAAGATRRGCDAQPTVSEIGADVVEHLYAGCDGDVEMLRYEIIAGGHTWPGNATAPGTGPFGYNTADISATQVMWEFLRGYDR